MDWDGMEWTGMEGDQLSTHRERPVHRLCVCLMRVLPSCAEVVVFDGRVTPHGTWVSPNANSTKWPFSGVALLVQSRAV